MAITVVAAVAISAVLTVAAARCRAARLQQLQALSEARCQEQLEGLRQAEAVLQVDAPYLQQFASQRAFSSQLVQALGGIFRGRGWLTQLKYDASTQTLTLVGYGLKMRCLSDFMAGLWQTRRLTEVRIVSVGRAQVQGRDLVEFIITARPSLPEPREKPAPGSTKGGAP